MRIVRKPCVWISMSLIGIRYCRPSGVHGLGAMRAPLYRLCGWIPHPLCIPIIGTVPCERACFGCLVFWPGHFSASRPGAPRAPRLPLLLFPVRLRPPAPRVGISRARRTDLRNHPCVIRPSDTRDTRSVPTKRDAVLFYTNRPFGIASSIFTSFERVAISRRSQL